MTPAGQCPKNDETPKRYSLQGRTVYGLNGAELFYLEKGTGLTPVQADRLARAVVDALNSGLIEVAK